MPTTKATMASTTPIIILLLCEGCTFSLFVHCSMPSSLESTVSVLSDTTLPAIGTPQEGQKGALSLISWPHSGHFIIAIIVYSLNFPFK